MKTEQGSIKTRLDIKNEKKQWFELVSRPWGLVQNLLGIFNPYLHSVLIRSMKLIGLYEYYINTNNSKNRA